MGRNPKKSGKLGMGFGIYLKILELIGFKYG